MSQPPTNLPSSGRDDEAFGEIVRLIEASRSKALQAANTALIDLYWQVVGETISRKIEAAARGDAVVDELAAYIARTQLGLRGLPASFVSQLSIQDVQ